VNDLTVPNSTANNDIQINVFVSMGDDFEVFVPDEHFQSFVFKPQSGNEELVPEKFNTSEPSAPQQEESDQLGPGLTDLEKINAVFTGESIQSFRTLLKRYNFWRRNYLSPSITANYLKVDMVQNMFPFLRGNVPGAVDTANSGTTATNYNYCNTVLMHWVVAAFQGWRGSIRYKILFQSPGYRVPASFYVQRVPYESAGGYGYTSLPHTASTIPSGQSRTAVYSDTSIVGQATGPRGLIYANSMVNPTLEFEVPYYSPNRFYGGKTSNWTIQADPIEGFSMTSVLYADNQSSLDFHVAAGEDFQCYMWTGLPRMYYEADPPPA
jgi:hypothetical protein